MRFTSKKINNLFFILLLILFWSVCISSILKNQQTFNQINNRASYQIKKPSLQQILNGTYQDNLEQAISDQMPKYNYFQLFYPVSSNYINYKTLKLLNIDNKNTYIDLGKINLFNSYLVYDPHQEDALIDMKDDLDKINFIQQNTNANIYLYYINNDSNINFETNEVLPIDSYLKDNLSLNKTRIKTLAITRFSDYKQYFYKLDHHWNNKGVQKAYLEITKMMNISDTLKRKDEICFQNKKFLGSKSKSIALHHFLTEKICVDQYDYPNFTIQINHEEVPEYGTAIEQLKNMEELSYAIIYGGDYEEITFTNNDTANSKNLLIYSNSYSNSINKLLASYYKNTYVIDGRYSTTFDMVDYIQEKQIDDVLILANDMLFKDTIRWGDF